jgi:hypothetical protein
VTIQDSRSRIDIPFGTSKVLLAAYVILYLLVALTLMRSNLPFYVSTGAWLCCAAGLILSWRLFVRIYSVKALILEQNELSLECGGERKSAIVVGQPLVTDFLVVLSLKFDKGGFLKTRVTLLITQDSVSRQHHRILRVWLAP